MGSLARDESLLKPVEEWSQLHARLEADRDLYQSCQQRRLRRFLQETVAASPFYQDTAVQEVVRLEDPLAAFEQLPRLEKLELREMSQAFMSGRNRVDYFRSRTTGSTGVPLEMWFDDSYYVSFYAGLRHYLSRNQLWPQRHQLSLLSVGVMPKRVYAKDDYWFVQPALNYSFFQRMNVRARDPNEIVRFLISEQPLVIRGVASSLHVLAGYAREHSDLGRIRPRLLLSTAETLMPSVRRDLEEIFEAPVRDEYGLAEVGGFVARECEESCGFHVIGPDYLIEAVDSDGRRVPPGTEGEILITNLYHTGTPILRYRTGDHGVLSDEPCACGLVSPRLVKFTGRDLCRFVLANGDRYNPFDAYREFLLELPVNQFQLVQGPSGRITLRYVGDPSVEQLDAVHGLRGRVQELHEADGAFGIERLDSIGQDHGRKFHVFLRLTEPDQQPEAVTEPPERPYHAL